MFFVPRSTAVIVIGSDRFDNHRECDRACFKTAADAYVEYFRSDQGLNVPTRNILNMFGKSGTPPELYDHVSEFFKSKVITDLFIVVVSHGDTEVDPDNPPRNKSEAPFRFMIRSTNQALEKNTFVYFDELERYISQLASEHRLLCRKFYIIDACRSGAILGRQERGRREIKSFGTSYSFLTEWKLPVTGSIALVANSPDLVGDVLAVDDAPDLPMPLFSNCLLQLLNTGDPLSRHPAFNLVVLCELVDRSVASLLKERPLFAEFQEANKPAVIELEAPRSKDERAPLYEVEIFPNNTQEHQFIVHSGRRFRQLENRLSEIDEYKNKLHEENQAAAKELEKQKTIRRLATGRARKAERHATQVENELVLNVQKLNEDSSANLKELIAGVQKLNDDSNTIQAKIGRSLNRISFALIVLYLLIGAAGVYLYKTMMK